MYITFTGLPACVMARRFRVLGYGEFAHAWCMPCLVYAMMTCLYSLYTLYSHTTTAMFFGPIFIHECCCFTPVAASMESCVCVMWNVEHEWQTMYSFDCCETFRWPIAICHEYNRSYSKIPLRLSSIWLEKVKCKWLRCVGFIIYSLNFDDALLDLLGLSRA